MSRRGLVTIPQIAKLLGKGLSYTYQLSSGDPDFPPVEKTEDQRKFFNREAVLYYRRGRRWYRPRQENGR
jgi:hypothetical protein